MISRRELLAGASVVAAAPTSPKTRAKAAGGPVAIASGNGLRCVERALQRMKAGEDPMDAAIEGVGLLEADPAEMTVGYGGIPNEDGVVQLDACVMHGPTARAGAVASLEGIKHPAQVAKKVLESTDHVLLVGPGAQRFARMHGFPIEDLLTEKARKVWLFWKQNLSALDKWVEPDPAKLDPAVREFIQEYGASYFRDLRSNGTVHVSALDARGDLGGCTSTSGLFFKMPGRVGDSPLIGAGCFTDNEVGSAGSTGRGEANILVAGSHTAVELMRQGKHPMDACLEVLERIAKTTRDKRLLDKSARPAFGIRFYAVSKSGAYGGASMWSDPKKPAQFAVADSRGARLEPCAFLYEGQP
jgi:N4-(beta-N-acetylglucosaminyl)-L-asparaginase